MEVIVFFIFQFFFATHSILKIGEYRLVIPKFWLAHVQSFDIFTPINCGPAQIVVVGHHLFLGARSFPQASLLENCLNSRRENVCGQISDCSYSLKD